MIAYGPCVDPWLTCTGGGADEVEEFFEPDWSMLDVVGFDTATPNLISAFARGEL